MNAFVRLTKVHHEPWSRKEDQMATTNANRTGKMRTEVTTTEARQGLHVGLVWVLSASLALAVIAGVALGFGWITLPWSA